MKITTIDGALLKKSMITASQNLEENKEEVNSLNVFPVPDGDTGTNMSLTFKSAIKQISSVSGKGVGEIASLASNGSLMGARGNSGVILSQLFRGFSMALKDKDVLDVHDLAKAFRMASDMAYKAVMKPTEGTILTVAKGCADIAEAISQSEDDILVFMKKVISYGYNVLDKTPDLLPVLKQAGVVDAGGKGLMYILAGIYNGLAGHEILDYDMEKFETSKEFEHSEIDTSNIEFAYCTEFIIHTNSGDYLKFRDELVEYGDSLLVVEGDSIIKVHIHTNKPGKVLEKALKLGQLNDIKIDNMKLQHDDFSKANPDITNSKDLDEFGFIVVSSGEGIDSVFRDLKANHIVNGGQTMNPSTEDLLKAISKVNAKKIIIFPNNSNIILAAEQARDLSDKDVYVFPSKSIPQGLTALLTFDETISIDENLEAMKEAVGEVKTGQVTFAVRDTEFNDKLIKKGDIIGLSDDEILSVGTNIDEISFELINKMVDQNTYLITIFYGEDTKEEDANKLFKRVKEEFEDYDVELIYGGQPLYYYIFSIE